MTYDEYLRYIKYVDDKMVEQKGICPGCGKPLLPDDVKELSHIIPQRTWILNKYGADVIHHPLNMKLTHTGSCNPAVQISPNKTGLVNFLVEKIRSELYG